MSMVSSSLALVTGAAHRLGRSFDLTLARLGYSILLHYHNSHVAAEATAEDLHALAVTRQSRRFLFR